MGYRETLESVVVSAGKFALSQQDSVRPDAKVVSSFLGDESYVSEKAAFSEVDAKVQLLVMDGVYRFFPGQSLYFLGEESNVEVEGVVDSFFSGRGFNPGGLSLIVDPIDGTKNFLSGSSGRSRYWGVSACLCDARVPVAMAVSYPALGVTLSSVRGEGTYLNGSSVSLDVARQYSNADFVRVSGSVDGSKSLRSLFPSEDGRSPGSLVTTVLSMFPGSHIEQNSFIPYSSYIGGNTAVYDFAGLGLAYSEAGGVLVNRSCELVNPFDNVVFSGGDVRINDFFVMAPSVDYASSLLRRLSS